jgi:RimJ/RimL family protein N-acetyltransferase
MITGLRGVSLRQIVEADMPFLFRLFTDPRRCHLWMRGRGVFDESGFERAWAAWTSGSIAAKFVVASGGQPVGLIYDHDRTLEDGWTKATTVLQEESVGHGAGVTATALFMDWLFQNLPLRKVYHEVYAYNPSVVRIWRKLGLVEEGVFKQDRYLDGAYWDLHVFALYRDAWTGIRPRVLRLPGSRHRSAAAGQVFNRKEVTVPEQDSSNGLLNVEECVS